MTGEIENAKTPDRVGSEAVAAPLVAGRGRADRPSRLLPATSAAGAITPSARMISTRRFLERPAGVVLSATGMRAA